MHSQTPNNTDGIAHPRGTPHRRTFLSASVANSRGFFYISTFLLFLTVASLRVLIVQYLDYQQRTKVQVVELLQQRNFPIREEERQVIVAAVLNAMEQSAIETCSRTGEPSTVTTDSEGTPDLILNPPHEPPTPACTLEDRAHEAFRLSTQVLSWEGSPDSAVDLVVNRISSALQPESSGTSSPESPWYGRLTDHLNRFLQEPQNAHSHIVPCAAQPNERTVHERAFGFAGCDPHGASQFTRLLVASRGGIHSKERSSGQGPSDADSIIPSGTPEILRQPQSVYPDWILRANDFSFVLESILSALSPELLSQPKSLAQPRLVQAYFISADSLLRYWDLSGESPYEKFKAAHLWGATGLIQLPLEYQEKFLGREPDTHTRDEHDLLFRRIIREKLHRPYIDLGGYGVVRSQCTPATESSGRLLGVFCTDISLPLRLKATARQLAGPFSFARSEPFIHFSVLRVPHNALTDPSQCIRVLEESRALEEPSNHPAWIPSRRTSSGTEPIGVIPREEVAKAICSLIGENGGAHINEVTRLDLPSAPAHAGFLVPISGAGELIKEDYVGLLLEPRAPDPPAPALFMSVSGIMLLVVLLALRIHVYKQGRLSSREDAMLRDLQSGLIDVSDNWCIEYANDRAEELFNTRFPSLGSTRDLADCRNLWDLVDSRPMWHWRTGNGPENFRYIAPHEINRHRSAGHSFAYYVRLRYSTYGRPGALPEGPEQPNDKKEWLRIKGSPIFKAPGTDGTHLRTFAVVQAVTTARNGDLEAAWENHKRTNPQASSGAFIDGSPKGAQS